MVKQVRLPDGRIGQFPDEMPHEDIENVLRQQFSPQQDEAGQPQQTQGLSGVMEDLKGGAYGALPKIGHMLADIPRQAYEAGKQIVRDPLPHPIDMAKDPTHFWRHGGAFPRAAMATLSGLADTGVQVGAAPTRLLAYLGDKGLVPEQLGSAARRALPQETGLQRLMMGEQQPGDELWQGLAPMVALKRPFEAAPMRTGAALTTLTEGDPFTGAGMGAMGRAASEAARAYQQRPRLPELEQRALEAEQAAQEAAHERAVTQKMVGGDEVSLEARRRQAEQNISDLEQRAEHVEPEAIDYPALEQAHAETSERLQAAHDAQQQHLNPNETHFANLGNAINQGVEQIKARIRPLYQETMNEAAQHEIPRTGASETALDRLGARIGNDEISLSGDERAGNYDNLINQIREQYPELAQAETVPGDQFIRMYKSLRDAANEARMNRFREGISQGERDRWQQREEHLNPLVEQHRAALEEHLPEETYSRLREADQAWRHHVTPFYNSRVYRKERFDRQAPKRTIQDIAGEARHNRAMQNLIQSDPEMSRLAVAQEFAHKPHELLDAADEYQPYIRANERINELLSHQRSAHEHHQRLSDLHDDPVLSGLHEQQRIIENANRGLEALAQRRPIEQMTAREAQELRSQAERLRKKRENAKNKLLDLVTKGAKEGSKWAIGGAAAGAIGSKSLEKIIKLLMN